MSMISLNQVVQRSAAGQALRWGSGALPADLERVLMRLTGFTPLARLTDPEHDGSWLVGAVERLLEDGLVELVDAGDGPDFVGDAAPDSSWGELALALPA